MWHIALICGVKLKPMASDLDQAKLSSPRIFLLRMLVFLILCALVAFVLHPQILRAFMANPGLNGLIIGVLCIGIILSFHRVIRLFPGGPLGQQLPPRRSRPRARARADAARADGGDPWRRAGRPGGDLGADHARLPRIRWRTRLDEARDISRYLTGLLVFLGLLGTFWGLIETVGSVGGIINGLKVGGDADTVFDALKQGLAAPLGGMGISFSSSLFGLAGSLVLGFLDLQTSQAQNRFYTNLEDWLATTVQDLGAGVNGGGALPGSIMEALERLRYTVSEGAPNKATTTAMANLAEAIQGLVQHMRAEQQMIRDWAEAQAKLNGDIRRFMEILARDSVHR